MDTPNKKVRYYDDVVTDFEENYVQKYFGKFFVKLTDGNIKDFNKVFNDVENENYLIYGNRNQLFKAVCYLLIMLGNPNYRYMTVDELLDGFLNSDPSINITYKDPMTDLLILHYTSGTFYTKLVETIPISVINNRVLENRKVIFISEKVLSHVGSTGILKTVKLSQNLERLNHRQDSDSYGYGSNPVDSINSCVSQPYTEKSTYSQKNNSGKPVDGGC